MESHVLYDICFDKVYDILKKMYLNILCTFSEAILCNNLKKMSNNESFCLFVEDYDEDDDVEDDEKI